MFETVDPKDICGNVFDRIGKQWMLITAGTPERCNTMTASWGGLGVLWNKPVAICYIRPQRYTKEFVEREEFFTLAFLPEERRKDLALCGAKSGRDVDKVKECGFTVAAGAGGAPYFEEAELVLVCRKLYRQDMEPGCFLDASLVEGSYPGGDFHTMYIGEIVEALQKK